MLINSKLPKSIAGCTKCPLELRVWDLCRRNCLSTAASFL